MHQYKELKLWQKAIDLVELVYKSTLSLPDRERFNLVSQINRATVAIPSNIAEGAGRNYDKEFVRFLSISNASSYELETQLIIAQKLNYLSEETLNELLKNIE